MKHVIPQSGSVYADKGYYDKSAKAATAKKIFTCLQWKKQHERQGSW